MSYRIQKSSTSLRNSQKPPLRVPQDKPDQPPSNGGRASPEPEEASNGTALNSTTGSAVGPPRAGSQHGNNPSKTRGHTRRSRRKTLSKLSGPIISPVNSYSTPNSEEVKQLDNRHTPVRGSISRPQLPFLAKNSQRTSRTSPPLRSALHFRPRTFIEVPGTISKDHTRSEAARQSDLLASFLSRPNTSPENALPENASPENASPQNIPPTPGSDEHSPSPSKRPRLDGTPHDPSQPGMMPNGRPQQGTPSHMQTQLQAEVLKTQEKLDATSSRGRTLDELLIRQFIMDWGINPASIPQQRFGSLSSEPRDVQAKFIATYTENLQQRQAAEQLPVDNGMNPASSTQQQSTTFSNQPPAKPAKYLASYLANLPPGQPPDPKYAWRPRLD